MADKVFESLLVHVCDLQRPVKVKDIIKNPKTGYETYKGSVKCLATPVGGNTEDAQAGALYDADWMFDFLPCVSVRRGYQIIYNEEVYLVKAVLPFSDGQSVHHIHVLAKLRDIPT